MRFIRKNGRVIPIHDRVVEGAEKAAIPAAVGTAVAWTALRVLTNPKATLTARVLDTGFWSMKGAITGGVIGGLVGAARQKHGAPARYHPESGKAVLGAFKRSLALQGTASVLNIARPFIGRNKTVAAAVDVTRLAGHIGGEANAIISSALAKKGDRGKVLLAGAAGSVAGANLMRLGRPIIRNRSRLGLKRFI